MAKKPQYSYKPSKTRAVRKHVVKLPVKHHTARKQRAQQEDGSLSREEKYAALVIIVVFIGALYYLFTQ